MRATATLLLSVSLLASTMCLAAEPGKGSAELAEKNRELVVRFYDQFFNQHLITEASALVADDYKQHNPMVADGKAPFVKFFTGFFKDHPQARSTIVRTAVDGDLVWMHNHSTNAPGDAGRAIVNIFRVHDGKIVEHWDVIQPVPDKSANANSMF